MLEGPIKVSGLPIEIRAIGPWIRLRSPSLLRASVPERWQRLAGEAATCRGPEGAGVARNRQIEAWRVPPGSTDLQQYCPANSGIGRHDATVCRGPHGGMPGGALAALPSPTLTMGASPKEPSPERVPRAAPAPSDADPRCTASIPARRGSDPATPANCRPALAPRLALRLRARQTPPRRS